MGIWEIIMSIMGRTINIQLGVSNNMWHRATALNPKLEMQERDHSRRKPICIYIYIYNIYIYTHITSAELEVD